MEKRKRFDDELVDLENPGADDSFLNEYLQDEESKKKQKKSSPLKTIKISFKKISQPNETPTPPLASAPVSLPGSSTSIASPSVPPSKSTVLSSASVPVATAVTAPPIQQKPSAAKNSQDTKNSLPKEKIKDLKNSRTMEKETKTNQQKNQQPAGQALDTEKIKTEKKVVNDKRLEYIPKESKVLGHVLYTGAVQHSPMVMGSWENLELFLLPKFSVLEHYALIQVRIPFEFLDFNGNLAVQANAVWGTNVYTDDSDVIAALIHSGKYKQDREKHDLAVTLRILPRLEKYQGSDRNGISSRSWGSFHDGESFKIENVETLALGSARKLGRKKGSKAWANQSSSLKNEARLVMTSEEGWLKYSLPSIKTSTWTEKLNTHDLLFELDSKRFELCFKDSKFLLKDKSLKTPTKSYKSLGFTDSGILLDDIKLTLDKYVWRLR